MPLNISHICNKQSRTFAAKSEIVMSASRYNSPLRRFVACILIAGLAANVFANPTGMTVASGSATSQQNGSLLNINVGSQTAYLNWNSFNIQQGETTTFNQLSSSSVVFNNIGGASASQIYGNLQANGIVVLMNPSGFYFGPNSFVSTAGLVVSTAVAPPSANNGGNWEFNGPPPMASIVNYGQINIGNRGSAYLIADNIENHGNITAPQGNITLAAGQQVLLSERPDGRGISMQVTLPSGSVDNYGNLLADGGTISANAQVVNQNGLIQANSVRDENGVIELIASDQLNLGANSQILAHGDDSTGGSPGGNITLKSGNDFSDNTGGKISVAGGSQGGNGGNVEVSAPNILSLDSQMDANAQHGFAGGQLFLDPDNIILDQSGGDSAGSGTVSAGDDPGDTLDLNVYGAFYGFSQITLQAKNDITLANGTFWSLSDATGLGDGQLTLEAGNDIIFEDGSEIYDANNWSLTLKAGVNDFTAGSVQSGVGTIYLNGGDGQNSSGTIQLSSGSVNLTAGQDIQVGSGAITTTGGGNIIATAIAGSVNTGTDEAGYDFNLASSRNGDLYDVDSALGGISTAGGGDVNITAGLDIISFLPTGNNPSGDAGSGAFGAAPGNVTLNAGRNVEGHFVVANGTGAITAGSDAGTSQEELALSLIDGGWTVNAIGNILLQEVRNPNGIFNNLGFINSTTEHYFDYAPDDYVTLDAGDSVELSGDNLPRNSGSFEQNIPPIYPSTLDITAGAGGILLGHDIILFPSPLGSLDITTTDGGSFVGTLSGDLAQFTMSDSGQSQYTTAASFGISDHASVPVHLDNATPVELNISGDMDDILLTVPEAATINVGGDMNNSRFVGQNLRDFDVTSINVAGDILNRNEFTSISVASTPDLSLLNEAYPSPFTDLFSRLHYDPATQTLTFQGRMNSTQLSALENVQVEVLDKFGFPELDANGNPVLKTVSILDTSTALALFNSSQDVPLNPGTGYIIGGGGQFDINARNLDLGATLGIQSIGPANDPALANYFTHGADIDVDLSGNLDMFSTTISSLNGGSIFVDAGGYVNVGSTMFTGNDQYARGIFTVANSPVTVIADGDINVNGSRIATYDGGDITIESLYGDVDAGTGGRSSVAVEEIYVDPVTRAIETYTPVISGSGILAITFPAAPSGLAFPVSKNTVGNIFVETPGGNIIASAGGVVQLQLNNDSTDRKHKQKSTSASTATVTLIAGEQPVLSSTGTGDDIQILVYDAVTKTWNWETGKLHIVDVYNPKTQITQPQVDSQPVFSDQNVVGFGSTFQLPGLDANGHPIFLTEILNAGGTPLLDASGNPLYAKDFSASSGGEIVDATGNPFLDANGESANVVEPLDASGDPFSDSHGNPVLVIGRNIDANNSGVIGQNVNLQATGNITGLIFAQNNLNISAQENVNVTALAGGPANVSANNSLTGTIIAGGGINAGGGTVDASLLSEGTSNAGGDSSGAQKGFTQGTAGDSTSQGLANDESTKPSASSDTTDADSKKKGKQIGLAQKVSRVTVILPAKNKS
jgi:filamentous hemagglutinin family protein